MALTLQARLEALATSVRDKFNAVSARLPPLGGTAGQQLARTSAGGLTWVDDWIILELGADVNSTSITMADVAGLAFSLAANKDYEVEGKFLLRTSLITTGPRLGVALPTGLTDSAVVIRAPITATTEVIANLASNQASGVALTTGEAVANVSYLATLDALIRAGSAPVGTFRIQFASEIAASSVTLRAGSFIRYRAL